MPCLHALISLAEHLLILLRQIFGEVQERL